MGEQRAKLSRGNDVAKAMDYVLRRWTAFTRFLDDGRICLSNNAAERGVAVSLWVGSRGCSAARIAAASGPR
jgi:Transposase IS66 family